MNPVIYAIAMVSFLIGSFGYVLVRFLVVPVVQYGWMRKKIARLLAEHRTGAGQTPSKSGNKGGSAGKRMRRLSDELTTCYTDHLPRWYRLYIEDRRGQSPLDAARILMALSNTRDPAHAAGQIERIRRCLKLDHKSN